MDIKLITVGAFAMNAYLVIDDQMKEAFYIDPGGEAEKLIHLVERSNVNLKFIINTHCHIDHTAEVAAVQNHFKVPFYIHRADEFLLETLKDQGQFFGMEVQELPEISGYVDQGDRFKAGNLVVEIIHTPGHSPGGISIRIDNHLFAGDVLFFDSIGRTDLPGGNLDQLMDSIKNKLMTLADDIKVYPGHGPTTTIGRERKHNPFLQM